MIDELRLKEILSEYKKDFIPKTWENEKYKWEAVKVFQDNWDIDAEDFVQMLERSLSKTGNLLGSQYYFPRRMIRNFAEASPEEVRQMFAALFDESKDVIERITAFKETAISLREKYAKDAKNHYQDENSITTYLWLRYPDKYYIFKFGLVRINGLELNYDYRFKKGGADENLRHFFTFYDEICKYVGEDEELTNLFKSQLTDSCYPDPEYKTLTLDLGYYIGKNYSKESAAKDDGWQHADFSPGLSNVERDTVPERKGIYSRTDFLNEVYMSEDQYDKLCSVLKRKKNVILQGAPGVGKTFAARRLAYSIMGEKDESRIEFVQFHQNYSYEDFMMGYKPSENGFEMQKGIFYKFCQKAANYPDKDFFFIIDEINRGNISKIFGELLMLIENDKRGNQVALSYGGGLFAVPENLYIIGMMNTADRSLAMIDYALRRRFSFVKMEPAFDSEGFRKYKDDLSNDLFSSLIDNIKKLNEEISGDSSLGKGFCIGHSYFCNWKPEECTIEKMQEVVDYEILPMLEEYWFDDEDKYRKWADNLHRILK